ncbi:MAG TPA: class I tRNA ligase family protein, partial [Syntrophales bacterium]|nr:class I tRNA ligase family protein [Syntrophales bacterium]
VWFDSGVSHAAVLETRQRHRSPADLYLEGSDQHRGWFHSSLLESVGTRGQAPYRSVLTHGFVVDGDGKKMSKSVGNVVDPQEIIDRYGAEILRLWVAAEDYTADIRISEEILKRLVEAYRRIRNTGRFILGNLYDFNPKRDRVAPTEMMDIDRWALLRLKEIIRRVRDAYERYQFHVAFYTLYNFCTVDLSALYLDVLKDRLYTSPAASLERRSAQTAMMTILDAMTRLLAPILTFTAEELWGALPPFDGKASSVHLTQFPEPQTDPDDAALGERWKTLIALKGEIAKAVEIARQNKVVGHSLDAAVALTLPEMLRAFVEGAREELKTLSIVSRLVVVEPGAMDAAPYASEEFPGLMIGVSKAPGEKCNRCWMFSETVGSRPAHPTLCERCARSLEP